MTTRERHGEAGPQGIEALLLKTLQGHDVMSTGCNENSGMELEYRRQAHDAARLVQQGFPVQQALHCTFEHYFGADSITPDKKAMLDTIAAQVTASGANT